MKITSLEIKQHEFEKSFRGYNIEEVNDFLSNLAQEWDRMVNESKMLKMQLEIAEKETSKLREVEMTLIKTLRTAEDTSSRITENASNEAGKKIIDAEQNAANILAEAENQAKIIVEEAEQKSKSINSSAKIEFNDLETKFLVLEANKNRLLTQIQSIAAEVQNIVVKHEDLSLDEAYKKNNEVAPLVETPAIIENETIAEEIPENIEVEANVEIEAAQTNDITEEPIENEKEEISFSSAVNEINLEPETTEDKQDLEIIEGIGPKIREVLNNSRIFTFRDLATTPIYRIKDILQAAGPQFVRHDPNTWVDQALLAEEGKWDQLNELKEFLVAGKAPANTPEKIAPAETPKRAETPVKATEEMLDKVNKVKAAIRKAMVEKGEKMEAKEQKHTNEYETEKQTGGSFFDNLN
jgi:DivIVA domain-containing protein